MDLTSHSAYGNVFFMSNAEIMGTVYYASQEAQRSRLYQEGRSISTSSYVKCKYIATDFVELEFDSSGRNYVHVSLT